MLRAPSRSQSRTVAALVAGLLLVSGPVLLAPAAQAAAGDNPCLTEVASGFPVATACDDSTPPVTGKVTMTPAPNAAGYVNTPNVTFHFVGAFTDADPDTMSFQCQFWDTATAPDPNTGTWTDCGTGTKDTSTTHPVGSVWRGSTTETGLADSEETDYHLRVRAVDMGDNDPSRVPTDGNPLNGTETDTPDYDYTFDQAVQQIDFRVDTTAPNTFLGGQPVDDIRPDWPMVTTDSPQLQLHSNEGSVTYVCAINTKAVPCQEGITTLAHLTPGNKVFTAYAVDVAGNRDPTPVSTRFSVPTNLSAAAGFTTYRAGSYFDGDYLESRTVGAMVKLHGSNVRELRLIAPAGPTLGEVEVKIGRGPWLPVDLHAAQPEKLHVYEVRDRYQPLTSGTIRVRVLKLTKKRPLVRIDAVLARD